MYWCYTNKNYIIGIYPKSLTSLDLVRVLPISLPLKWVTTLLPVDMTYSYSQLICSRYLVIKYLSRSNQRCLLSEVTEFSHGKPL